MVVKKRTLRVCNNYQRIVRDDDVGGVFWDSKIQTLSERADLTLRSARVCAAWPRFAGGKNRVSIALYCVQRVVLARLRCELPSDGTPAHVYCVNCDTVGPVSLLP